MTRIIIALAAAAGILALGACTTVKESPSSAHTSSTTTESTSVEPAAPGASQTQTVRSY